MVHQLLEELQLTKDPVKKAAIIAEFVFSTAESDVALVARQCVILHWFDLPIVEAFLSPLASSRMDVQLLYSQLAAFPFIDKLPWGLTYNSLTREGLLRRYIDVQPKMIIHAAHVAMNAYLREETEARQLSEAFYCAMISGDTNTSQVLLEKLLEQAICRENWLVADQLFQLQKEAELFPFVEPLPYTEYLSMLRALVRRVRGEYQAAIADYDCVIALHPTSGLAYSSRGTTYAECHQYQEALADYDQALALDPINKQLQVSRDIILAKQARSLETLQHFANSLSLYRNKSLVHNEQQEILETLFSLFPQKKLEQPETEMGVSFAALGESISNTAKYHASVHALWTAFITMRHEALREMLIEIYIPLVRFVVGRLGIPPTSLLELDDLMSYGMIGLINAIDRFNLAQGVPFEAFATPRIRGAMIDHLRSLNWQPRATASRVHQVEAALASVEQKMGRPATEEEVASELGVSVERYRQVLLDASTTVLPIGSFQSEEMAPFKDLLEDGDTLGSAEEADPQEPIITLSTAIEQLPEHEQLLLALYYQEELTMKEISKIMRISESRVCQLHMQAIMRLRGVVPLTPQKISSNKGETVPVVNNKEQQKGYFEGKNQKTHKRLYKDA